MKPRADSDVSIDGGGRIFFISAAECLAKIDGGNERRAHDFPAFGSRVQSYKASHAVTHDYDALRVDAEFFTNSPILKPIENCRRILEAFRQSEGPRASP